MITVVCFDIISACLQLELHFDKSLNVNFFFVVISDDLLSF